MENALGTGHGGCDEETEEVNEADGDDDDKDAHARKAKFAEQKKAASKRWREKQQKLVAAGDQHAIDIQANIKAAKKRWNDNQQKLVAAGDPHAIDIQANIKAAKKRRREDQQKLAAAGDPHAIDIQANHKAAKKRWNDNQQKLVAAGDPHAIDRQANKNVADKRWNEKQKRLVAAGDQHAIDIQANHKAAKKRWNEKQKKMERAPVLSSKTAKIVKQKMVGGRQGKGTAPRKFTLSDLVQASTSKTRASAKPDAGFDSMLERRASEMKLELEQERLLHKILAQTVRECRVTWGDCGGAFDRELDDKTIRSVLTKGDYHVYVGMTTSKRIMSEAFTFVNRAGLKRGNRVFGNSVLEYSKPQRKTHSRPTVKEAQERLNFLAFAVQGFANISTANLFERLLQLCAEEATSRSRYLGIRLWRELTTFALPPELELAEDFLARVYICVSRVDRTKMDLRAGTVHLNGVEMRIIK
jgi:hypothetical protein